ncbi:uncharacterized protein B0H64DRAFT_411085 [Chaetomium fimeti]|uniref:F-box domain-containing protein n=1 Tax=Chaetomium fimeti TaxID=1854472 RepID=A0AAE0H779_9PEZI|nr:hypothetical protein B0H64DRAFT_411085 [Chaetomium fimeti]
MHPIQPVTAAMDMAGTDMECGDASRSSTTATISPANLASLPFDVQWLIVWDEGLSADDIKALRLTCRALVLSTTTRLFYRIGVSKLNVDRESFLSICHNPDLAKHVHEVEWCELSWDPGYFDRLPGVSQSRRDTEVEDDADLLNLCRYFHSQAEEAFWLPNVPISKDIAYDVTRREREEAVAGFRETFMAAVDQLPNLHTFVSRPMTSTRTINPGSDYPMDANIFQTFQNMDGTGRTTSQANDGNIFQTFQNMDDAWRTASQANDGLFLFIFPAMARPSSAIHRLRWADELPGYSYLRQIPPSAFEGLESLDLCWAPFNRKKADNASLTAACSIAAPTLRHLGLCLAHGNRKSSPGYIEEEILGHNLAASSRGGLESLTLRSMNLKSSLLVDIVKINAACLRHVHLEDADARVALLSRMVKLPGLQLTTFQVSDEPRDVSTIICAHALARYMNGDIRGIRRECDDVIHNVVEQKSMQSCRFATKDNCECDGWEDDDWENGYGEAASDAASDTSKDSLDMRRINGPKWAWGRFYNESGWGDIWAFQVPSTHPDGHPTCLWRFTSRDGEVGYGEDPLDWFDEWDPSAGDIEEPTPYCRALREFDEHEVSHFTIADMLGMGSPLLDVVEKVEPPEGAFPYDPNVADEYVDC